MIRYAIELVVVNTEGEDLWLPIVGYLVEIPVHFTCQGQCLRSLFSTLLKRRMGFYFFFIALMDFYWYEDFRRLWGGFSLFTTFLATVFLFMIFNVFQLN